MTLHDDLRVKPKRAAEIVTGSLTSDDSFPVERELIETYGVSRPTLREALRILETEGLLVVTRGVKGGARVVEVLGDIHEGRALKLGKGRVNRRVAAKVVAQHDELLRLIAAGDGAAAGSSVH